MTNGWQNVFDSFYTRFVLRDFFGKIVPGGILLFAIAVSATSYFRVIAYLASMSFWAWIAAFGGAWLTAFAIQSFAEKPLPRCKRLILHYPKILFTVGNGSLATELDKNTVPEEVREAFRDYALTLTGNAGVAVIKQGQEWEIVDDRREFGKKFIVRKAHGKLSISYPEADKDKIFDNLRIRFNAKSSPDEKQQLERRVVIKEACGNGYVAIAISWIYAFIDTFFLEPTTPDPSVIVPVLVVAAAAAGYLCKMHFDHVKSQHEYMVESLKFYESAFPRY